MMIKKCNSKAESTLVDVLKKCFITNAFADENSDAEVVESAKDSVEVPEVNIEQLLANVRQEEKAKLYPEIKKLKEDLAIMTKNNNDNLIKCATLESQLDSKGEPAEMGELRSKITELTKQVLEFETEKAGSKKEEDIRAEIEAEYAVKLYKTEKLGELKEVVLPTFLDLIQGDTIEEIDLSIEKAKSKTLETKELLGVKEGEEDSEEEEKVIKKKKKPSVTNPNSTSMEDKLFDEDYVRNLDPKSQEYAEWRVKVGLSEHNF